MLFWEVLARSLSRPLVGIERSMGIACILEAAQSFKADTEKWHLLQHSMVPNIM